MNHSTRVNYRGLRPSAAVAARIALEVEQLRRACPHVIRCDVLVEQTGGPAGDAATWKARTDVLLPGGWLIAREPAPVGKSEGGLDAAVEDAFEEAHARLLETLGDGYRGSGPHGRGLGAAFRTSSTAPPPSTRWIPAAP